MNNLPDPSKIKLRTPEKNAIKAMADTGITCQNQTPNRNSSFNEKEPELTFEIQFFLQELELMDSNS